MPTLIARDVLLAAAALAAAAASAYQCVTYGGNLAISVFPLAAFFFFAFLPRILRARAFLPVAAMAFLTVVLDSPTDPGFDGWMAPTKQLGMLFFGNLSWVVPQLSFVSLNVFEIASAAMVFWLMFRRGRPEFANFLRSSRFRSTLLVALALPVAGLFAALYGILAGYPGRSVMYELHPLPTLGLWIYVGYVSLTEDRDVLLLVRCIIVAVVVKCLEGWWVYFVVYHGEMGSREFLMEHITSEQIAIAMFAASAIWLARRRHRGHDALALSLLGVMLVPYFLNLRRASFVGVGLTLLLIPVMYRGLVRRRHALFALGTVATLGGAVAITWQSPLPFSMVAAPLRRFVEPAHEATGNPTYDLDYRAIENYDLFREIADYPLTGTGFGPRLAMPIPLVDLTEIYPLYALIPHNNVLWIWASAGPLGMASLMIFVAFSFGVMLYLKRIAKTWEIRLLAFLGWGMIVRWLIYAEADLGISFTRMTTLLGLFVGMAVKATSYKAINKIDVSPESSV